MSHGDKSVCYSCIVSSSRKEVAQFRDQVIKKVLVNEKMSPTVGTKEIVSTAMTKIVKVVSYVYYNSNLLKWLL